MGIGNLIHLIKGPLKVNELNEILKKGNEMFKMRNDSFLKKVQGAGIPRMGGHQALDQKGPSPLWGLGFFSPGTEGEIKKVSILIGPLEIENRNEKIPHTHWKPFLTNSYKKREDKKGRFDPLDPPGEVLLKKIKTFRNWVKRETEEKKSRMDSPFLTPQ